MSRIQTIDIIELKLWNSMKLDKEQEEIAKEEGII